MASITIRNLPDEAKEKLRLNAAKNKRSMEEEARLLLMSGNNGEIFPEKASTKEVQSLKSKSIVLIITGGVAAYKALDLIRRLQERGANVTVVMTKAATEFVTPLAAGSLSGGHVFTDLFQRQEEHDIGHIRLARSADLIVVAPATADRIAKMSNGIADDLAGAILLAANSPILIAPAMNPAMWKHPATQRNVDRLLADGIKMIGPESGEMAERGEAGRGRMSEPLKIVAAVESMLDCGEKPLSGKHIIVTSGPTHEPIDPVRYLANRSSGKQGHAIAAALHHFGARVTLVSGPVNIPDPYGVETIHVETAIEMLEAVKRALPADGAIFVAAVADWRSAESATQKIKKQSGQSAPTLEMVENPDILATIGHAPNRPKLVIGFAAETNDLVKNARKKLDKKGADFILANNVAIAKDGTSIMGGDYNRISCVSRDNVETWPNMSKDEVAQHIAKKVTTFFGK